MGSDYFSEAHHEDDELDEDAAKSAEVEKEILKYEGMSYGVRKGTRVCGLN